MIHDMYSSLYKTGSGFNHPVYKSLRHAKYGNGVGNIIKSVFKILAPIAKKVIFPNLKRGALKTVKDIATKHSVKTAIKRNLKKTGKNIVFDTINQLRKKKKKTQVKRQTKKKPRFSTTQKPRRKKSKSRSKGWQ